MIPARDTHSNPRATANSNPRGTTHANPRAGAHANPRPQGSPRAHQPAGIGPAPIDWEKLTGPFGAGGPQGPHGPGGNGQPIYPTPEGPFGPGGPQGPNGPGGNGSPIYPAPDAQKSAPIVPLRPGTTPATSGGGGPAPSYQFANDAVSLSPEAQGQDDDSFVNPFAAWDT